MTGYQSKKAAALDEEGMYLVHHTQPAQPAHRSCGCANCGKKDEDGWALYCVACIDKIKEALAQPAQEPVAWMNKHGDCKSAVFREAEAGAKEEYNIPLYTNQTLEKNT